MRFIVPSGKAPVRLDNLVAERAGITRSQAKKLIESGKVLIDGRPPAKAGEPPRPGTMIEIEIPGPKPAGLLPEQIPLDIRYMDDHLAVVDKPAGMVVYPAAGHAGGTLLNALAWRTKGKLASVGGPLRPGVVHRLDKDTTGLMVIALEDKAYYGLLEQFKTRAIKRQYAAIVWGRPREDQGVISLRIGRSQADRKKMSTRARAGKEAVTSWRAVERFKTASLVLARLGTGRTHQIRVHFASIGHPVLGDRTYGRKTHLEVKGHKLEIPRQMLHARMLGFIHPASGEALEFESPLPADMEKVLQWLRSAPSNQCGI